MRAPSLVEVSHFAPASRRYRVGLTAVLLAMSALTFAFIPLAVQAITTLSQGYSTTEDISLGSIVSLQKNTSDHVEAANTSNVNSILGVVINDGNSLLTLTNGEESQVQVATSGIVQILVSDINGEISQGDQITASPIKGLGMKATNNVKVVGIAQGTPVNSDNSKQTYTDKNGTTQTVTIGQVPVLINVSYFFKQPEQTIIPSAIQRVANAIAGKAVSPLPIIISAAIFLITLIVVASIVYSMIRSSIISVGRNPMSQSAVYRDVIQLSALVLVILGVAIVAIYMILTRF